MRKMFIRACLTTFCLSALAAGWLAGCAPPVDVNNFAANYVNNGIWVDDLDPATGASTHLTRLAPCVYAYDGVAGGVAGRSGIGPAGRNYG